MKITCPHCQREGSSKADIPIGSKVRCPGCKQKFEYRGPGDQPSSLSLRTLDSSHFPAEIIPDQDFEDDYSGDGSELDGDMDFSFVNAIIGEPDQAPPPRPSIPSPSHQAVAPVPTPTGPIEVIVVGRGDRKTPHEPWFYSGLEGLAFLDILAGVFLTLYALTGILGNIERELSGPLPPMMIVTLFCAALGAFSSGMFLLLIVDVARNIRSQRYKI